MARVSGSGTGASALAGNSEKIAINHVRGIELQPKAHPDQTLEKVMLWSCGLVISDIA